MVDAHLYCAQLNFICFLVFSAAALLITSWPEGGCKQRRARCVGSLFAAATV